jgi:esterase/lipase
LKKISHCILTAFCATLLFLPAFVCAEADDRGASIITATGQDVPADDNLEEDYRFPEKYRDNAVQFRTEDGVLLCGYVLGEGNRGITLAHANGWMVKSWLPFGERLADAGYMVILWEFRNIPPSGFAPESASQRWDLDVIAAAQVLKERGAAEIICMGASYGGTATAVAAPHIPELAGIGILSAPARSQSIDPIAALRKVEVPAFFAVSTNDSQGSPGVYQDEVKALYDGCVSAKTQLIVFEGTDHGTDMITPDVPSQGYASFPKDDTQIEKRQELSDKLLLFVKETFGNDLEESNNTNKPTAQPNIGNAIPSQTPGTIEPVDPIQEELIGNPKNNSGFKLLYVGIAVLIILVIITFIVLMRQRKH